MRCALEIWRDRFITYSLYINLFNTYSNKDISLKAAVIDHQCAFWPDSPATQRENRTDC